MKALAPLLLFLLLASSAAHPADAPALPPQKSFPIQAELIGSLDATRATAGERVLAKLTRPWSLGACKLPQATVLVGHVAAITPPSPPATKGKGVALTFTAPCGDEANMLLHLIALLAPDEESTAALHDSKPVTQQSFVSSSFGQSTGIGRPATASDHADMSGRQAPNLPISNEPVPGVRHPRPTAVSTGEVWRIPHVVLSVGSGPAGSSVVSSTRNDVRIPTGAVLVLIVGDGSAATTITASTVPPVVVKPLLGAASLTPGVPEATSVCEPGTCNLVVPAEGTVADGAPARILPLKGMAFAPRLTLERREMPFDAAIAWMGTQQLLFTFDPHALVDRATENEPSGRLRTVRAVVIDLPSSRVLRTVDWHLADHQQYLWPMHGDRVMVHAGNTLRIYGPGLVEQSSINLPGPLAWLRHSPDWQHIALGVVHELHTRELHADIAEATSAEPEEEVRVMLLDVSLHSVGSSLMSSRALPPVLTVTGELVLFRAGNDRWTYKETRWNGETRPLLRLNSNCMPRMTALGDGLLFVTGCETRNMGRWYRIWRPDGTLVLKGTSTIRDLDPTAISDGTGRSFALALSRGRSGYVAGTPFHGTDIASESVLVYSTRDGHRVYAASLPSPAITQQPATFAPDGHQLAVLEGRQIAIYQLPPG